jgi:hypothetical protein
MNGSDLHGGPWVHRSLLDLALRRLRRMKRVFRLEWELRVARAGSGCRLGRHLATCERAGYDLIGVANRRSDLRLAKELNTGWRADSELNKILPANLHTLIIASIGIQNIRYI